MVEIKVANTESDYNGASILFQEYAASLNIDLSFQNFDEELLGLKEMYALPNGVILLSKEDGLFTGCIAVRKKELGIAEFKRMYIRPMSRKTGLGTLLLENAIAIAKELGYKKIRLDTLDTMLPAINLYKKAGFYEIGPYYFNPEKNAVFFEKIL